MVAERFFLREKTSNEHSLFSEAVIPKFLLYSGVVILLLILIELKDSFENVASYHSYIQRILGEVHGRASLHKDLFPINQADVIGSFLVAVGLMIAASGGIGGGGILVPLLIMVFGFNPKYAIPLCNSTVFGSSITNVFLNVSKRHPEADRPLIDWDLVLLMEPLTIVGAVRLQYGSYIISSVQIDISDIFLHATSTKYNRSSAQ